VAQRIEAEREVCPECGGEFPIHHHLARAAIELPTFLTRRQLHEKMGLAKADVERIFERCQRYQMDGSGTYYIKAVEAIPHLKALPFRAPPGRRGQG
jgi:hypothetical protein